MNIATVIILLGILSGIYFAVKFINNRDDNDCKGCTGNCGRKCK